MWTRKIAGVITGFGITLIFTGSLGLIFSRGSELLKTLVPLPLGLVLAGMFFLILGVNRFKKLNLDKRIMEQGVPGRAKVIRWWIVAKSGASLDLIERCGFELEIIRENSDPYVIKHSQLLSFKMVNQLSKGMILPVKIDIIDPKKVLIITG